MAVADATLEAVPAADAGAHDEVAESSVAAETVRARQRAVAHERREARRRESEAKAELVARYVKIMCSQEIRSSDHEVRDAAMLELVKARIRCRLAGSKIAITTGETMQLVAECVAAHEADQASRQSDQITDD